MGLNNFSGSNPNDKGNQGNQGGVTPPVVMQSNGGSVADEFLINYNERFKTAGTILFRESITKQLTGVLIGKNKPNAILVGPAGTGKTKIMEDLAYRLENNDPTIPDKLMGCKIYELPLSNIVSGSSYVGQLEEKIKAVIDFAADPKERVILFIDEIHQLADDHAGQTYAKIAQILKPALARGDIRCVGATTSQEANLLMDDPALNRRFSRIIVDELTPSQTVDILENARSGLMKHYQYKVSIADNVLPEIVRLADEYRPAGSHRPDNALTLMDRACGDALVDYKYKLEACKNDPNMLAALQAVKILPVTEKQVKQTALRLMTGSSTKNDLDMQAMQDALSAIQGQDDVLQQVMKLLKRRDRNLFPSKRPLTILFTGSSGVGKTEVTKIIAEQLTGTPPIILNMTEYHSPASINRIIGSPAGYVGSDSKAELPFDSLESNPYQVILLDEFEKSDPSVQTLFMGAFDEGYIKTSRGKMIDFSRSVIIATTNAGKTNVSKRMGFGNIETDTTNTKDAVSSLSRYFKQELLNRFSAILTFHGISENTYRDILVNLYHRELTRIRTERPRIKLPDDIPPDELERIVKETYVPDFGARPAVRAVQEYIEDTAS